MRCSLPFAACCVLILATAAPARDVGAQPRSAAGSAATPMPVLTGVEVFPPQVSFVGPRGEQQVLVTGRFSDGMRRDLTSLAEFSSTNRAQLPVSASGRITAAGDGVGTVWARVGTQAAAVRVEAKSTADRAYSFLHDVIPMLTRAGCNQGACHGAQFGKGGLRLSLLGYDPEPDFQALVRDARRRRIVRSDPGASLLLTKPTLTIPHAGGMRFRPDSLEYRTLAGWIADGAPGPRSDEPEVRDVLVEPAEVVLRFGDAPTAGVERGPVRGAPAQPGTARMPRPGRVEMPPRQGTGARQVAGSGPKDTPVSTALPAARPVQVRIPLVKGPDRLIVLGPTQRLVVVARRADGSTEDVTRKAQFNSLNEAMATVDTDARVSLALPGQTAVMVRYRGKAAVTQFEVPYRRSVAAAPAVPARTLVDEHVARKWERMGLRPSALAGDAEYLRRVYLDVLGILPTPEEVRAFLKECEAERNSSGPAAKGQQVPWKAREQLVERVLARPEYADYWTLKWGDLLRNNRARLGEQGMWSFYNWLRAAFRENRPLDQMTRDLVTAQGSTFTTGPANYFRVATNAADQAETTSQVFLGVRLACAKCHQHPFEKWSQDDYWQMAAFFGRVGLKGSSEFGLFGGEQVVYLRPSAEVRNPRSGRVMQPTPLEGRPTQDAVDTRRSLAAWITAPENRFFARNWVNRYWSYLMGRGIVDPVDDVRITNPPSNSQLLDALANDFAAHGYDVKRLLRNILNSSTYQLSSEPTKENRTDEVFYTKYAVKRLGAEELLDALCFATGAPEKFPNLPSGFRAVQLPDPGVQSYFLETFGRPDRQIACECERTAEPNMAQALHLMNSDFVQNKVAAAQGRVAKLLAANRADPEAIEELYLVTFSRPPAAAEVERARQIVAKAPSRKEGLEDLLWALMNSREFLFKH